MQRAWLREFNALGLQLRPQAAKLITEFLQECENPQAMVEALVEHTKAYFRTRQGTTQSVIDKDVIQTVISCLEEASRGVDASDAMEAARHGIETMDLGDGIQVYDALTDVQPFAYRRNTRDWSPALEQPRLFPGPEAKAKIYHDRYYLLWQRLLLEGEYVAEADLQDGALLPGQRVLTPVESLVGNPGRKITFGLISRTHDDANKRSYTLEDVHRVIPIDLEVQESEHLITDGSFVIAEGELKGDRFRVSRLDVPAAVSRKVTREKDQVPVQVFGGNLTDEQMQTLARTEQDPERSGGMYVVLSEIHLDSARVLEKLTELFQGYEAAGPPRGYVFMGSFCSSAFVPTTEGVRAYREGFERLKFILRDLPKHLQCGTRFIFVPGPKDPGAPLLPRAPLPGHLTSDIAADVKGVIMATNPCRLRHFSRELVFFRHDVLRLLRRHEVVPLREPGGGTAPTALHVREEMVRLLLDQAHLVPLPMEESNVAWAFDHSLRLYPLPDAVFVGGISEPFDFEYQKCTFCSVGPFHRDASFFAYHPAEGLLEPCDVPDPAG